MACGKSHSLVLFDNGMLFSFGAGKQGQLGHGVAEDNSQIRLVNLSQGLKLKKVACGWLHSLAIAEDGQLFAWGMSHYNQLGHQNLSNCLLPKEVEVFKGMNVTHAAAGVYHSIVLTDSNELFGVGRNTDNQAGGSQQWNLLNKDMKEEIVDIKCGLSHNIILTKKGNVYCSGRGSEGQLGIGRNISSPTFVKVPLPNVVRIGCGTYHNIAVTADKQVWAWGSGVDYQLGTGLRGNESSPQQLSVLNGTNVMAISGGWGHSVIAVKESPHYL